MEQAFGHTLPTAFTALYTQNNGEGPGSQGFVYGLKLLSLDAILKALEDWRVIIEDGLEDLNDSCASHPENAIQYVYAERGWPPLLADWGGNYVGLDFAPGPKGRSGQVVNFGRDEEDKLVFADSLEAFVELLDKLMDSAGVAAEDGGGYALNKLHFIDALKEIVKPAKNKSPTPRDPGWISFWVCPGHGGEVPENYFTHLTGETQSAFETDFGIDPKAYLSSGRFSNTSGDPASVEEHLKFESRTKKYLKTLVKDAGEMGHNEVGMLHCIRDFKYDPATTGVTRSDYAVFVGHYPF